MVVFLRSDCRVCLLPRVPVLRILLTNTKVPRSTKVLVSGVKDKINKVVNGFPPPSVFLLMCPSISIMAGVCARERGRTALGARC